MPPESSTTVPLPDSSLLWVKPGLHFIRQSPRPSSEVINGRQGALRAGCLMNYWIIYNSVGTSRHESLRVLTFSITFSLTMHFTGFTWRFQADEIPWPCTVTKSRRSRLTSNLFIFGHLSLLPTETESAKSERPSPSPSSSKREDHLCEIIAAVPAARKFPLPRSFHMWSPQPNVLTYLMYITERGLG